MTACVCVDYLTHDWDSNDIIQANHEIKKQLHQIKIKKELADSNKEQKSIQIEHDRLIRFQNAIWRQMARICTNQLGQSNVKVSPSSVNWQKESDITWLYGPFYSTKPVLTTSTSTPITSTTPQGIKSVLKKPTPTSLGMNTYRPWSKTCSEPGTSPISVRFNPDIEQLEYIPESPVQDTMASDSDYWSLHDDEEDDEDDILWSVVVNLSQFVKNKSTSLVTSFLSSTLLSTSSTTKQHLPQQYNKHHNQQHHYSQQQQQQKSNLVTSSDISRETPLHIILLFLSMTKSFTSLIGTWFMYQSLLPFTWLIKHHHSQKNHHTTF